MKEEVIYNMEPFMKTKDTCQIIILQFSYFY